MPPPAAVSQVQAHHLQAVTQWDGGAAGGNQVGAYVSEQRSLTQSVGGLCVHCLFDEMRIVYVCSVIWLYECMFVYVCMNVCTYVCNRFEIPHQCHTTAVFSLFYLYFTLAVMC